MKYVGKVWLNSGNVVTLPPLETSQESVEEILGHVSQGQGYVAWSGVVILLPNVEAFSIWEEK